MKKKKLISGVLATLACAACFAGCDLLAPMDNPFRNNSSTQSASLEDAKDYLKALYKDMAKECATQYSVVSNVVINGVSHSVTWTVDDAAKEVVTVTAGETETVIKINQDKLTEDVTYTLTATITAPDGTTITLEFKDMKAVVSTLPIEGVAYKMYISHGGLGELYYLNGELDGERYLAMTKKVDEAKDIYTSIVDGGYKFYYAEGETKNYIYITKTSANAISVSYTTDESAAAIFNYSVGKADNSQYRCWWATFEKKDYAIGTRQTFDTVAASSKYFYDNPTEAQYPVELIAADKVDTLKKPELTRYDDPNPPTRITDVAENTAYKLYAYHIYKDYPMYLTGAKNSNANLPYYFPTAKEADGTRDFKLEATTGGYYLYNEVKGVKTYINVKVDGEHTSNFYEATPTSVWTFDATLGTLVTSVSGKSYCMGATSGYDTIQALATDNLEGCSVLYLITPPAGTEWVDPTAEIITLAEALEIAKGLNSGATTAVSYTITAEIKEVTNTTWGNTVLTDGKNTMTTYGLYNVDGSVRYDAMETKPKAGDLITIVAPIKNNSGTYRFENPQMQTHYSPTPVATMAALTEDTTPSGTYCVRGEIASFYLDNGPVKGYVNIKDAASGDTTFLIYGLSNYDGSVAYGSLENKPVVGDTISVIGELSYFKGTPQLKNARLMAYTYTEADPFDINAPIGDDVQGNSATYNFATITSVVPETYRVQYEDSTYKLDNVVSLNIVEAHINTQLRLYSSSTHDGVAIFTSTRVISGITLNIGKNSDALNIYGSTDGINWTLIKEESVTSTFSDHTIAIDSTAGYKYLKLDVKGTNQLQIKTMTINFVA